MAQRRNILVLAVTESTLILSSLAELENGLYNKDHSYVALGPGDSWNGVARQGCERSVKPRQKSRV